MGHVNVLFRRNIIFAFCPVDGLDYCHIFWTDPQRYGASYRSRIKLGKGMMISHALRSWEVKLIVPKIMRLLRLRGNKPAGRVFIQCVQGQRGSCAGRGVLRCGPVRMR